jgi:hypothetical protein
MKMLEGSEFLNNTENKRMGKAVKLKLPAASIGEFSIRKIYYSPTFLIVNHGEYVD